MTIVIQYPTVSNSLAATSNSVADSITNDPKPKSKFFPWGVG